MNNVIRELPPLLRDKIAAGEVVERPASVVKELVENSIDAGATAITVEIAQGGREFISVSDNASGIQPEYIKTAFLPHATSKITCDDDLETIMTKGFRGEALASIAAVAEVEVISKVKDSEFALSYRVVAGKGEEVLPAARDNGTTITVSRLFFNTPARLKFLKKDVAEGTAITDIISKIVLAHPEISFTMIKDGQRVLHSRAEGDLLTAINSVVAKDIHKYLKPLDYSEEGYRVTGYVGTAQGARATRAMQYFYVNSRYIKSKSFNAAVDNAVSGLFPHGKHPMVFLFLSLPPDMVDVNVHPAKIEVRFAEERKVFSAIYRSIKSALVPMTGELLTPSNTQGEKVETESQDVSTGTFRTTAGIRYDVPTSEDVITESLTLNSPVVTYSIPTNTRSALYNKNISIDIEYEEDKTDIQQVYNTFPKQSVESEKKKSNEVYSSLTIVGEVFSTYIIIDCDEELILMDKHAAHERIIYERLISQRDDDIDEQLLLTPLSVNIGNEQKAVLLENAEYLKKLGIEIEDFGGGTVRLYSLPADIDGYNAERLLGDLSEGLAAGGVPLDERTRWVYHSVACRAAIKAGDSLKPAEMLHLAEEILSGELPLSCPHGRPVMIRYTKKDLEGRFGRI